MTECYSFFYNVFTDVLLSMFHSLIHCIPCFIACISTCSTRQAACLLEDAPVKSEMYNMTISELPGQVYSGDQQCKHLYGEQATVCEFKLPNVSIDAVFYLLFFFIHSIAVCVAIN